MLKQEPTQTQGSILFLTSDVFNTTGGIQKVCRTFCKTLSLLKAENPSLEIQIFSVYDLPTQIDYRYTKGIPFKCFEKNKFKFSLNTFLKGIKSETIIISHINLISVAIFIKIFHPSTKIILIAHGAEVWNKLPSLTRIFLKKYTGFWCVSEYTRKVLQEKHQIKLQKMKVINNCIDPFFILPVDFTKPSQLLKRYKLLADQPVVLTIGRMNSFEILKGYDLVLKTIPKLLKEFPNLHYLLAGKSDPVENQRLQSLIRELRLQNHVSLIDFIEEKELSDHYTLADVFVLPSLKEGFGLVFIEAAACGCNVISGNKDGSTDALLNGKLGTMVDPHNQYELKQAIGHALKEKRNPIRSRMTQLKCLQHFGFNTYLQRIKKEIYATRKTSD